MWLSGVEGSGRADATSTRRLEKGNIREGKNLDLLKASWYNLGEAARFLNPLKRAKKDRLKKKSALLKAVVKNGEKEEVGVHGEGVVGHTPVRQVLDIKGHHKIDHRS